MFMLTLVALVMGVLGVAALLFYKSVVDIPEVHRAVVSRWGKRLKRELDEGINFIIPFVDEIPRDSIIDMHEQTKSIQTEVWALGDGLLVKYEVSIQWRPQKGLLKTFLDVGPSVIVKGLEDVTKDALRFYASGKTHEEVLKSGPEARKHLEEALDEKTMKWGIDVVRILIADISLTEKAREDKERQQREQFQQTADVRDAETLAKQVTAIKAASGVSDKEALIAVLATRGLNTLSEMKSGKEKPGEKKK